MTLALRNRAPLLSAGQRIVAELAAEAVDPAADLTRADRMALATLALAVEAEVARRTGADPPTDALRRALAEALARVERGAREPSPCALLFGEPLTGGFDGR